MFESATALSASEVVWRARHPLRTPLDHYGAQMRAAQLCGEEPRVFDLGEDAVAVCPNLTYPGSWELAGDQVSYWAIRQPEQLLDFLRDSGGSWFLNGIDGLTSGDFGGAALKVPANLLDVSCGNWEEWVASRQKTHHRTLIRKKLNSVMVRSVPRESFPFEELLEKQGRHLARTYWRGDHPDCDTERARCVWQAWIRALAEQSDLRPKFYVYEDVAATVTVKVGDRETVLITLLDHERGRHMGSVTLTAAVKAAVEDPGVRVFDLMYGDNEFKQLYEPSDRPFTQLLCVLNDPYWEHPGADLAWIPIPPIVVGSKIYVLKQEGVWKSLVER
jgi:hypothetical protein